jgi:phospholipid/cholesterol/gamma-HCH transport system substrate-binding protein
MNRGMWLGFLFFVALLLLGFGTLLIGNIKVFKKANTIEIHFDEVQALKAGDDVRVEGVTYGKVKKVELDERGGVKVVADLDGPIDVYEGYEVRINSSNIIGGTFVAIRRGNVKGRKLDVSQGLVGRATASALEEVGEMVKDNREDFRELIANLKKFSDSLKDPKGTMGKVLHDSTLHDETLKLLQEARRSIADLREMTKTYHDALTAGEGPAAVLLKDKQMAQQMRDMMASLERTAATFARITEKIDKGEGVAGTFLNDKESAERLKRTIENIEKTTESFKKLTSNIENSTVGKLFQEDGLYERAERTLKDVDKLIGRAARAGVYLQTEGKMYPDSDATIAKVGIRIEPDETKYIYAGAAFLSLQPESDLLTFEDQIEQDDSQTLIKAEIGLAYRIPWILENRITVRGGLIEGKPGGAVEFLWEDWGIFEHPVLFVFEGRDAYNDLDDEDLDENISGPMLRFWIKTPLWRRGDEWWQKLLSYTHLTAGVSRIGDDPEFFVGIGFEWKDEDIRTLISLVGLGR